MMRNQVSNGEREWLSDGLEAWSRSGRKPRVLSRKAVEIGWLGFHTDYG